MTDIKWSNQEIKSFFHKFQDYPCLWDVSTKEYLSKKSRDVAIRELTKRLNDEEIYCGSTESVKKRIKSLRDTYRKELIKIAKSKKSGASGSAVYRPKLAWFSAADGIWFRALVGRESSINTDHLSLSALECEDEDATLSPDTDLEWKPSKLTTTKPYKRTQQTTTKRMKPKPPTRLVNSVDKLQKEAQMTNRDGEDQYDTFGKHIASQLRELPVESYILLQSTIQNLITDERITYLDQVNSGAISQSVLSEVKQEEDVYGEEERLESE